MKKMLLAGLALAGVLASCSPNAMQGSPAAVQAGAAIGGMLGSIVGDRSGGYNGSQFGALIGTVAGAAVGNAVTTPRRENFRTDEDDLNGVPPASGLQLTNLRFVDGNRNHAIDAGEESKLVFDIVNNGEVPAYNVTPVVEEVNGLKYLTVSPSAQISYMPVGNRIRYTATIHAGQKLKDGQAAFRVYAIESNGATTQVHEFTLPTQRRMK